MNLRSIVSPELPISKAQTPSRDHNSLLKKFNPTIRTRISRTHSINDKSGLYFKMRTEASQKKDEDRLFVRLESKLTLPLIKKEHIQQQIVKDQSEVIRQLDELIKQQFTTEHLSRIIGTECNYATVCRIFLVLKDKEQQMQLGGCSNDGKFTVAWRMSEIYATIVVLISLILKQNNQKSLRLLLPTIRSILRNHQQMLLFKMQSLIEEFQTSKQPQLVEKCAQIRRLLDLRMFENDPHRKGRLVSTTFKLKQTLSTAIHKQQKYLSQFSVYMQSFAKNSPQTIIQSVLNQSKGGQKVIQKEDKLLDQIPGSISPVKQSKQYTLFLDLDETLVHYMESMQKLLLRPYLQVFLKQISKCYQIIIYTAASKRYADWVIDNIDINKVVSRRLYRQDTVVRENMHLKSIQKADRKVEKSLIVDNVEESFSLHPTNGIKIRGWYGQRNDRVLRDLFPVLKVLSMKPLRDLRQEMAKLRLHKRHSILQDGFSLGG